MITKIHLENFKGIKERQTIELKPITLLFGANSAGKSTVIQALHYAKEILERKNFDPFTTKYGSKAIDLGGFKSLVYQHDYTLPIIIEIEMDMQNHGLPYYTTDIEQDIKYYEAPWQLFQCLNDIKSVSVKLEIIWSDIHNMVMVACYETGIDGETIGQITLDNVTADGKAYYKISKLNFYHPIFPTTEVELTEELKKEFKADYIYDSDFNSFHRELASEDRYSSDTEELDIKLLIQKTAIPEWGDLLEIDSDYFSENDSDNNHDYQIDFMIELLSRLCVGPGQLITEGLNEFRYLGPLREIPERNFEPEPFPNESRWANGLGAWDVLYRSTESFVKKVNQWLSGESRLNTGYSVQIREYKELNLDDPFTISLMQGSLLDDIDEVREEINKLPTHKRLVLFENGKLTELKPYDVGVGISQLLPVIVGTLYQRKSIFTVEQPELHVHPAIQVNLGDLFISQIHDKNCIFLIETHSEHLMLRLLRRIEETTNDELPPGKDPLKAEQVSVNYFEQSEDGIKILNIPIDETGEFTKPWPKGFFEERAEELFG